MIAVISSNITQRGEPAAFDKFARARMAIDGGADLAIELPVVFSCASAGAFASAAVDLLDATGVVTHISFGAEGDLDQIKSAARAAADEPPEYREALRRSLDLGASFARAQSDALELVSPGASHLMRGANNTLAVAYVARLIAIRSPIEPIAIPRVGAAHDQPDADGDIASAGAIRGLIRQGRIEEAARLLPESSARAMRDEISSGRSSDLGLWWRIVRAVVSRSELSALERVAESSEGFERRAREAALRSSSLDGFVDAASTRRYTRGRVRRWAAALALGLTMDEGRAFQRVGPRYLRVLAANGRGRELLRAMKDRAKLPVISRPSAPFDETSMRMMRFEHVAADLRELATPSPRARAEASSAPYIA